MCICATLTHILFCTPRALEGHGIWLSEVQREAAWTETRFLPMLTLNRFSHENQIARPVNTSPPSKLHLVYRLDPSSCAAQRTRGKGRSKANKRKQCLRPEGGGHTESEDPHVRARREGTVATRELQLRLPVLSRHRPRRPAQKPTPYRSSRDADRSRT